MKKISIILISIFVLVIFAFISGLIFVVDETRQVVITQFGKPVGKPITTAGLHFKKPFIQQANYFEKRLLQWDGDAKENPTSDKKYIFVDVTARWQISDALKFLQSVGHENSAQAKLDNIINSATRDIIAGHLLVEAVRNSNRILEKDDKNKNVIVTEEAIEHIETGRQILASKILNKAKELVPLYGLELIDVRIKRINYVEAVRQKVYDRMVSERKQAAVQYRSEGQGRRAEIDGKREKELKLITSEAYRKAQGVKGKADAEAINIYAQAYDKDPDFYSFLKTLETYEKTIDNKTSIILTTDSDYYKYLKKMGVVK
jgi:membrane protease subunit HflC